MSDLKFGIFDHVERRAEPPSVTYQSHLDIAALADQLDFHCYHLAEHHGTGLSLAPSPSTFLAAVALRTTRIRLGPLVYLLPMHNPLRVAEEVAMLDHLSDGRFELGVGRGASPIELDFFGVDAADSGSQFEEAFDIILRAMVEGTLDHRSDRYEFRNAEVELTPLQKPHPPIWYPTSGTGRLAWAAERGYHTVLNGPNEHVREQVELFRAHIPAGHEPIVGVNRYVVIGSTTAEAERMAQSAFDHHLANLLQLTRGRNIQVQSPIVPPSDVSEARDLGRLMVGTPDDVAEQTTALLEATGCNYFVFAPMLGDLPLSHALDSMEAFSNEVIPAVRRAVGVPVS
jgi:alkanesulfonate monooxygenase SsuD/methylene tetrahydromethanopterin reductase-like flavin-dependent oxidoreductase (luciferase family)